MSDIDFYFVPKTGRGYELGLQFILDGIGYDLWPVSWERLAKISNLEEQIASILMDGVVLFASSEDDLLKLEDLRRNLQQNLKDAAVARQMSLKYLDEAKSMYFDMQVSEGSRASGRGHPDRRDTVVCPRPPQRHLYPKRTEKDRGRAPGIFHETGRVPADLSKTDPDKQEGGRYNTWCMD